MNNNRITRDVNDVHTTKAQNNIPSTYGEVAPRLEANGYPAIPIEPGQKSPFIKRWQLAEYETRQGWQVHQRYKNHYIGVRTGSSESHENQLGCYDVDILPGFERESAIVSAVFEQAHSNGKRIVRVGKAPGFHDYFTSGERIESRILTFNRTNCEGSVESFAIDLRADKKQSVIIGVHPSTHEPYRYNTDHNFLNTPRNDLPSVSASDVDVTFQLIIDELVKPKNGGWTATYTQGKRKAQASNINNGVIDPCLDIPTESWQSMTENDVKAEFSIYDFRSAHYDYGVRDHDDLIKTIKALTEFNCWGIRDVTWAIMSVTKFNNEKGQNLAFNIMYCSDHSDPKYREIQYLHDAIKRAADSFAKDKTSGSDVLKMSTYVKVRKLLEADKGYQLRRSREAFDTHRATISNANDATLEFSNVAIAESVVVNPSHREQLVELYRSKYENLFDAPISKSAATKLLARDEIFDELNEDVKPKRPLPTMVFDDAMLEGGASRNQHGEHFVEFSSGGAMPVLSASFAQWCLRRARRYDQMADDRLCKTVALNLEAELKPMQLPVIPAYRRMAQSGVGTADYPIVVYVNSNDDTKQLVRISDEGVDVLAPTDAPMRFVSGEEAGIMDLPTGESVGSLQQRVERFWYHMPVPKSERMKFLGTMVNAFFTSSHQPILCLYSPPPGGDAKSPTLYRWRQLIDPRSTGLPSAPSDRKSFTRMLANGWCVAFDDIDQRGLPSQWQKKLNSYTTGGSDTEPTLYVTGGTTVLETAGPFGFTTNHNPVTNPETIARMVRINFEKLKHRRSAAITNKEFSDEVDTLRWTLFELVSAVIRTLPSISDVSGHRFDGYAQIVNALHKILGVQGSLSETLAKQRRASIPDLMDRSPFILDIVSYISMAYPEKREVDISPGMLLKTLMNQTQNQALVMLRFNRTGSTESNYPTGAAEARTALTADPEMLSLLGLAITKPPKKQNGDGGFVADADACGKRLRIKLNENAPRANQVSYELVNAVKKLELQGEPIPESWIELSNDAELDSI